MGAKHEVTFFGMARDLPVRTALFSFGPLVFAVLQLANGYLNGGSIPLIALVGVVMLVFSVVVTRYNMALYRLSRLRGSIK